MAKKKAISAELKSDIVKAYLVNKVPVSELAEKHGVQPSNIYCWVNALFSNADTVFRRKNDRRTGYGAVNRNEKRIAELESKLLRKNEVLGELMEEHVKLKKDLGVI